MFTGLSHTRLKETLSAVKPVELKGVALLRQRPPNGWFPADLDPAELAEASVELIAYTQSCQAALRRLGDLRPIPLTGAAVEEFSL